MDDCIGIPELRYSDFSQRLHARVGNQHIPIVGTFELTMRCNLHCQHCYIPLNRRAKHGGAELSLPEIQRILDQVTEAGCFWLLLTGGEPLLRKDFLEIYTYAKHKGLILTLFTNGTLLTPKIVDALAEWRPFNIEITLYGATQDTYERVTGIPGSYARCRKGIDLLLERNLPLGIKTMVMTLNYQELEQMKSLAAQLVVQFRFDPIMQAALDGSKRPTNFRLSPDEIVQIEKADQQRAINWPKTFRERMTYREQDRRLYLCGAGNTSFHIDASGSLCVCLNNRKPGYNLKTGNFREGWEVYLPREISVQYSEDFLCGGCPVRFVCAQCPALAQIENQDDEQRIEYLCQLTRLRLEEFVKKNDV